MCGKQRSSGKRSSSSGGGSGSGGRSKGSGRVSSTSERDEIITFRKYLNYEEADRLNRTMDENAANLDRIEHRLKEIDLKLQAKKHKRAKSHKQ